MKIAESKEGNQVLLNDNGTPKNCPFQPVQLIPHPQVPSQPVEFHKPCGNWCPFFELRQHDKIQTLGLTCTGSTKVISIDKIITNKTTLQKL